MIHKNSFRISRKRFFISGLLVLILLVLPVSSARAFSMNDFVKVDIDFSPTITKLHSLGQSITATGEALKSQTANVFDSLRNAWRAYVNPLPTTVGTPTEVGANVTVATPPPIITDQALLRALRILFAQKDYLGDLEEFRGQRGPEGTQGIPGTPGPQGPAGPAGSSGSSSVTYIPSNPSTNFGGASIFSVTDLSSNKLITETAKVTTLNVEGTSTLTGTLNATSIAIGNNTLTTSEWAFLDGINQTLATTSSPTFNVLTVTSCTGCSPSTSLALSTAISDETCSGALVFANTPTLVTPLLGVATGTSLALGGGTALTTTNQTGTGSIVLATLPTLVTPTLGVATATSLTV